jgi:hypothetical protein
MVLGINEIVQYTKGSQNAWCVPPWDSFFSGGPRTRYQYALNRSSAQEIEKHLPEELVNPRSRDKIDYCRIMHRRRQSTITTAEQNVTFKTIRTMEAGR